MIIFALFSIPLVYFYVHEKIALKGIFEFFIGIVVSSIVSIIMWAFASLYLVESDQIIYKTFNFFLESIIPLYLLFLIINYLKLSKRNYLISVSFFVGFLYWNMLFQLFTDSNYGYSLNALLLPIVTILIVVFYYVFLNNKINDNLLYFILMPLIYILYFILSQISYLFIFIYIIFIIVAIYFYRLKVVKK